MDTKSKKYNKALITGIIIVSLASALFVASCPVFEKKEAKYRAIDKMGVLENEEFISVLLRNNYVLYKDVIDKSGNKGETFADLYIDMIITDMEGNTVDYNVTEDVYNQENGSGWEDGTSKVVGIEELNSISSYYSEEVKEEIENIRSNAAGLIGMQMDYYVLDKSTGASIKNTSRPIDELIRVKGYAESTDKSGNEDGEEGADIEGIESLYDYYVIMDYDSLGNLQNISVKGQEPDKLLKLVRSVYGGNSRLLTQREETEEYGLYDGNTGKVTKQLTIIQKKPANTVFAYAVTSEQMEVFAGSSVEYHMYSDGLHMELVSHNYTYYMTEAYNLYLLILAGIFVITILLAVFMPAALAGKGERKAPIEIIAAAALFWLMYFYAGSEVFRLIAVIEKQGIVIFNGFNIKYVAEFIISAFLFAPWYFLCLEVSDIMRGAKEYIQTRSLIYRCIRKILVYLRGCYDKFRTEIAEADLGNGVDKLFKKLVIINFCLLCFIVFCWGFGIPILILYSIGLYYLIKKYIGKVCMQYKNLLSAVGSIAGGNLNNTFEEDFGVFESSKKELSEIQNGFKNAVEKEVKSQMMKTELITNVSHDLKTPLTAIITYIDLMKDENITEEQRQKYLATLERKSLRLKVLIEDLFEISRASSGNINFEPVPVDICNLMRQAYLENEDKIKQAGLQVRFTVPDEKVILKLDPQKTYRIFENLYGNISKYALRDTRVFVSAQKLPYDEQRGSVIHIEIKNISAQEIEGDAQYLSERFVRGDASRNTEGSGLGLAIARSFTELQGGIFRIETDGDLFKVILEWEIGSSS